MFITFDLYKYKHINLIWNTKRWTKTRCPVNKFFFFQFNLHVRTSIIKLLSIAFFLHLRTICFFFGKIVFSSFFCDTPSVNINFQLQLLIFFLFSLWKTRKYTNRMCVWLRKKCFLCVCIHNIYIYVLIQLYDRCL